ncbi:MAG: hypothetical protein IJ876_01250 [Elusimicrobiaceae bacterium]|nr:hypothetical protein [Elusimicrobiaceae bacterium]
MKPNKTAICPECMTSELNSNSRGLPRTVNTQHNTFGLQFHLCCVSKRLFLACHALLLKSSPFL